MKYSGLVLDIDNFKFLSEDKLVDKFKILKYLIDKDIPIILCTDGDFKIIKNIMNSLNIKDPAIVMEGAKVYSTSQCECDLEFHLAIKTAKELCLWAQEKNIGFEIITNSGIMDYEKWFMEVKSFLLNCESGECPNVLQVIMDISSEDTYNELLKFISKNNLECYSHVFENKVVFMNSRVDKGLTLRCLSKNKRWDLKKFIAIGEYPKDVSLFEEVGLGISVGEEDREYMKNVEQSNKINVLEECINNYF